MNYKLACLALCMISGITQSAASKLLPFPTKAAFLAAIKGIATRQIPGVIISERAPYRKALLVATQQHKTLFHLNYHYPTSSINPRKKEEEEARSIFASSTTAQLSVAPSDFPENPAEVNDVLFTIGIAPLLRAKIVNIVHCITPGMIRSNPELNEFIVRYHSEDPEQLETIRQTGGLITQTSTHDTSGQQR